MTRILRPWLCLSFLTWGIAPHAISQQRSIQVRVSAVPSEPYIEVGANQFLNFDFLVTNESTDTLRLDAVELWVFDGSRQPIFRRALDNTGTSPGILTVSTREFAPGAKALVFNPFHTFPLYVHLSELRYEFRFALPDTTSGSSTASDTTGLPPGPRLLRTQAVVKPVRYKTKTTLIAPLAGRVLVMAGHDFYAHHRRYNYADPFLQQLGIRRNFSRYAYDFSLVNELMQLHPTDDSVATSWFGYGATVRAPADGRIAALRDGQLDNLATKNYFNLSFNQDSVAAHPMMIFGNHIVIDHGNGEYSLLGHLKRGSITVQLGQTVRKGQVIAKVGFSGSTFNPHLHYELRTRVNEDAEGLPSYFSGCLEHAGREDLAKPQNGHLDTGVILECR